MNRQILKWQIPSSVAPSPLFNSVAASRKVNKHENNLIEFITRITSSTLVQIKTQLSLCFRLLRFRYLDIILNFIQTSAMRCIGLKASLLCQFYCRWVWVGTLCKQTSFIHDLCISPLAAWRSLKSRASRTHRSARQDTLWRRWSASETNFNSQPSAGHGALHDLWGLGHIASMSWNRKCIDMSCILLRWCYFVPF